MDYLIQHGYCWMQSNSCYCNKLQLLALNNTGAAVPLSGGLVLVALVCFGWSVFVGGFFCLVGLIWFWCLAFFFSLQLQTLQTF